jgi:hypothetical protein
VVTEFAATVGGPYGSIANGSTHPTGTEIRLTWYGWGATSCAATGSYVAAGLPAQGEYTMPALTGDIQVTMTCTDGITTDAETLTFYEEDPVVIPTASISINPTSQLAGVSYRVTWACTDADAATSSWSGAVATSGFADLTTTPPQTHTITCTDTGSSTSRSASATVNLTLPTVNVVTNLAAYVDADGAYPYDRPNLANNSFIDDGDRLWVTWVGDFADDCDAAGTWTASNIGKFGNHDFGALTGDVTVTITCSNSSDSTQNSLNFFVNDVTDPPVDPVPTLTFSASPLNVTQGLSSVLTWDSTYATSCTASGGWSGTKAPDGSETTAALGQTTRFRLTCIGSGGSVTKETAVTVRRTTTRPRNRWWRLR